jgi:hypothetical protein
MEVYIQNVAPDEARGWVPIDDNYFLGQLQVDDGPMLRPFGQKAPKKQSGVRVNILSNPPSLGNALRRNGGARLAGARSQALRIHLRPPGIPGESRCFVFDVRPLREGTRRLRRPDLDRGSRLQPRSLQRRESRIGGTLSGLFKRRLGLHMDGWRVNAAPGVWVPSYVYSEETDLNTASSSKPSKSKPQVRFKSQTRIWDTRPRTPTAPAR